MAADEPQGEDWASRRKARSVAIAVGLAALVVIFYAATIVRLGPNAVRKDGLGELGKKNFPVPDRGQDGRGQDQAACKKSGTC